MKDTYKEFLFSKRILVNDYEVAGDNAFAALYSFGKLFGVNITEGRELADERMIPFMEKQFGIEVPEPFYRGFPQSVQALSPDAVLFDRIVHYTKTYGFGMFDDPGHSMMENFLGRTAFEENVFIKDFVIITEKEAEKALSEAVSNLFKGTRPLNESRLQMVEEYINDFGYVPTYCASKNLAIKILLDLRNKEFAHFLVMSDVIKLAEEADYNTRVHSSDYFSRPEKKLNLTNRDRKLITEVINELFKTGRCNTVECFEKKAKWSGLLHHLHYKPINEEAEEFAGLMRGRENRSVYSEFERLMSEGKIVEAAARLCEGKSSGALLRNLEYIVSRCEKDEQVCEVLELIDTNNTFILLQLVQKYGLTELEKQPRDFKFTKHNLLQVHFETAEEVEKRLSFLSAERRAVIKEYVNETLKKKLKGRLGRVYIDYDMKLIALPLQENTAQGGLGVLPKGSRLPIPPGKKIRTFTYWEKVNDIDLSCFGMKKDGSHIEFSWRNFLNSNSGSITFSGDETSGYKGGSEYFDIVLKSFREDYPDVDYIVFCNNVYSAKPFSECVCKAGYMMRDINDSGQVFEPKTVNSSFTINCESTFAYLFALDLNKREFVWLNVTRAGEFIIAGETSMNFLRPYFEAVNVLNMHSFFSMLALEIVSNPSEADVIVSDKDIPKDCKAEIIRSWDFEKVTALM